MHISVIYRRAKYDYQAGGIPADIMNKVVKEIKDEYNKGVLSHFFNLTIIEHIM